MKPYLPNDIMNMILQFRTDEMKKQRNKLNYDRVIKELDDIHVLLYAGHLVFVENKSILDSAKIWLYSSPFLDFL